MTTKFRRCILCIGKLHEVTRDKKDGLEKYLRAMMVVMASVTVCTPLISFELVQLEVHVFGQLKMPYGLGGLFWGATTSFLIFVNWLMIFIFVQGAMVYEIGRAHV